MYNPARLDIQTRTAILNALLSLNDEIWTTEMNDDGSGICYNKVTHSTDSTSVKNTCGSEILANILNTAGLVEANTQIHMGTYSAALSSIPGIFAYYDDKYPSTPSA